MSVYKDSTGIDREAHIRAIAYSIWEEEGRPDGRAEAHWLQACELVDAADGKAGAILDPDWLQRAETADVEETPEVTATNTESATDQLTAALQRLRNSQAA